MIRAPFMHCGIVPSIIYGRIVNAVNSGEIKEASAKSVVAWVIKQQPFFNGGRNAKNANT